MNLNITKDNWENDTHHGELFPGAEDRVCAYQDEGLSTVLVIRATDPRRAAGKLNHAMPESIYSGYELHIERHTGTALTVKLVAKRKDIVQQRIVAGKAVQEEILLVGLSFGQLCNRIFGPGAQMFHEVEHFPDAVRPAMASAYQRSLPVKNPKPEFRDPK